MHNLIVRDLRQKNLRYTLNTDNVEPLVCDPFTMGHTQGGSAFFSTLFYFLWLKIHNLLNAKRANVAINVESYQQQILLRFPFS